MLKKQKHITGFLSLLICLSLGLSTVHTHEQIKWDQDSHASPTEFPNTIVKDTNLCPVDGFLYGANVTQPISPEFILIELEINPFTSLTIYEQPSLLNLNNRSPPFQA